MNKTWYRYLAALAVVCGFFLVIQPASASVTGTLLTGSSGTVTATLTSITFNNDPAATSGSNFTCTTSPVTCNSDVASGTTLTFSGGSLTTQEGIDVNSPITGASVGENDFLTFSNNANLVFNLLSIATYTNTNCAALTVGESCVVASGEALLLTDLGPNDTLVSLTVGGKASDTGVAGLATGSSYTGTFSESLTGLLPNGMEPTPANIQAYFCPGGVCSATASITSSQSGSFTASTTPEPSTMTMMLLGSGLVLLALRRKTRASR